MCNFEAHANLQNKTEIIFQISKPYINIVTVVNMKYSTRMQKEEKI